jgi:cytochrome c5
MSNLSADFRNAVMRNIAKSMAKTPAQAAANQARALAARAAVLAKACPEGQTYNRSLKACRDKKKPGRPAGAGKSRRSTRRSTRRRSTRRN